MYDNNSNPFDPSEIFDKVQAQLCKNDFCTSAVPAQIQGTKEQVILAVVTSTSKGGSFTSIGSESALFVFRQSASIVKKLFLLNVIPLTPKNVIKTSSKSIEMRLPDDNEYDVEEEDDEEKEVEKKEDEKEVEKESSDEDSDEDESSKEEEEEKNSDNEKSDNSDNEKSGSSEDESSKEEDEEDDEKKSDKSDDESENKSKSKSENESENEEEKEKEKEKEKPDEEKKEEEEKSPSEKVSGKTVVYESTIINTFTESFFGKVILKKTEGIPDKMKNSFRWIKKYKPMKSNPENPKLKTTEVNVFFGTWNVNGISPPQSLAEWLGSDFAQSDTGYPDIYCVGFQELDMSANALILGNCAKVRPWEDVVYKTISAYETYELVHSRQLVGIFLCVFVKSSLNGLISGMRSDIIPSGLLGVMGNKGGVGIRFNINDSTFCVVNCHLNAYMDNVLRRNQDYHEIESKMTFSFKGRQNSIWDHDFLFWMGDLNYRIEAEDEKVRKKITKGDYDWLLSRDQLRDQMRKKLAFDPFLEPQITFQPTYKYIKNTNEYVPATQNRIPAYCDRVLWKAADGEVVRNTSYMRHELLGSDHRPVSATFVIEVKSGVADAKMDMRIKRRRHIDEEENERIPSASLSTNEVNFENLDYEKRKIIPVHVRNDGQISYKWRIESCKKDSSPKWLTINPESGSLEPEEECVINFKAYIDQHTAKDLCEPKLGCNMIDEIFILHLDNGRDYFISVIGTYRRSCFGMAIDQLIHYRSSVKFSEPDADSRMWVPKELWRLVDFILLNALDTPDLFAGTTPEKIAQVREVLDADTELDKETFTPQDVVATLLAFLSALYEPIISEKMYILFDRFSEKEAKRNVDNNQGDPKYSTLYYMMSLLREFMKHSKKNKITKEKLSEAFYTPFTHLKFDRTKIHVIGKLI